MYISRIAEVTRLAFRRWPKTLGTPQNPPHWFSGARLLRRPTHVRIKEPMHLTISSLLRPRFLTKALRKGRLTFQLRRNITTGRSRRWNYDRFVAVRFSRQNEVFILVVAIKTILLHSNYDLITCICFCFQTFYICDNKRTKHEN